MMHRSRTPPPLAICIPARDEAAELPGLFDALERLRCHPAQEVHVCLLLDNCRDESAELVAAYRTGSAHRVHVRAASRLAGNVGRARHQAMRLGQAALPAGKGLLLTTDADSRPAPDWLTTMTAALAQADVVAGRILRCGTRPNALQDRLDTYYDALFALRRRIDPVPWEAEVTHHHSGGANIGIRAAAYRALGGFPPLTGGEDAHLIDEAARSGFRVRRDAACLVTTSDRRDGRCPAGLANALRLGDRPGDAAAKVAHPRDALWQYHHHAIARAAYDEGDLTVASRALSLGMDHILGVARGCPNAEAFAMRIVPAPPAGMRHVPLAVAEVELAALSLAQVAA